MKGHYIDDEAVKALKKYKYSGEDNSLIYKYFGSPSAAYLVEHYTPVWIAPNLITLLGFIFVVMSHLLTVYYAPYFNDDSVPQWVWLLCGVCLFVYYTMDNMDGKQARKTGSSSPLGLLFDHGCDAMNCSISALTIASCMKFSSEIPGSVYIYAAWSMCVLPFFFCTWEEYHLGKLKLYFINGPNEGIMAAIMILLSTGVIGQDFWIEYDLHSSSLLLTIPSIITCVYTTYCVIRQRRTSTTSSSSEGGIIHVIMTLYPIINLTIPGFVWILSDQVLFNAHPRLMMLLYSALFTEITVTLMLAHAIGKRYTCFRWILAPIYFGIINSMTGDVMMNGYYFLVCYSVVACLKVVHFVYFAIVEISTSLDIPVFTIRESKKIE